MSNFSTSIELAQWYSHINENTEKVLKFINNSLKQENRYTKENYTLNEIWHNMLEYDILNENSKYGWVDPDGEFYGCRWAAHEFLLDLMGLDVIFVEQKGWVRITTTCDDPSYINICRMTNKQIRFLKKKGITVCLENERMKPRPIKEN